MTVSDDPSELARLRARVTELEAQLATSSRTAATDQTQHAAVEKGLQDMVDRQALMQRETSHRVKNSLQLVANLLQLQALGARQIEVRDALNDAVARVLAVAQVHDRLWRQQSADRVEFGTFVRDICGDLQQTAADCTIDCAVEVIAVPTGLAVSLGLILNELVANAFKHGRSAGAGAAVAVQLRAEGGVITLAVRDHGTGLPAGFSPTATTGSLGMRLINGMLRQLDGSIEAADANPGARFAVRLPLPDPD